MLVNCILVGSSKSSGKLLGGLCYNSFLLEWNNYNLNYLFICTNLFFFFFFWGGGSSCITRQLRENVLAIFPLSYAVRHLEKYFKFELMFGCMGIETQSWISLKGVIGVFFYGNSAVKELLVYGLLLEITTLFSI
jgi:hypothetical protein